MNSGATEHIPRRAQARTYPPDNEVETPHPIPGGGSLTVSAGAGRLPQQSTPAPVETDLTAQPANPRVAVEVRCPECRGAELPSGGPCGTCRGEGEILVFWASDGRRKRHHLVVVYTTPAACLCGDEIPVDDLAAPGGIPCFDCMRKLSQLATGRNRWNLD